MKLIESSVLQQAKELDYCSDVTKMFTLSLTDMSVNLSKTLFLLCKIEYLTALSS